MQYVNSLDVLQSTLRFYGAINEIALSLAILKCCYPKLEGLTEFVACWPIIKTPYKSV